MLIYRLRGRILQFKGEIGPRLPDDAVVNVAFSAGSAVWRGCRDKPQCGDRHPGEGSGKSLRFVLEWSKQLFEPVAASIAIADTALEVKGNVVSVRSRCTSEQDLADLLAAVFYAFPAVANLYLPDTPYPTHAWEQQSSTGYLSQQK